MRTRRNALAMLLLGSCAVSLTACRPRAQEAEGGPVRLAPSVVAGGASTPASVDGDPQREAGAEVGVPHGPCCPEGGPPPGWVERPALYENMEIISRESTDNGLVLKVEIATPNLYAKEGVMAVAIEALEPMKEAQGDMARMEALFWQEVDGVRECSLGTAIWVEDGDVDGAEAWRNRRHPSGYWYRAPDAED